MEILKPNIRWNGTLKPLISVDRLLQHHMAHTSWTFNDVHIYHRDSNGWLGIGYNYWIAFDGTIYEGRGLNVGAHAGANWNSRSIGIGYQGNFETQKMTNAQLKSGAWLNAKLIKDLSLDINAIGGHNDVSATLCPGKNFRMAELKTEVTKLLNTKDNLTPIFVSSPRATIEQSLEYIKNRNHEYTFIVDLFYQIAKKYKLSDGRYIDPAFALCQSVKETGFYMFNGIVKPWQCNTAGIGATGVASDGNTLLRGADPERIRFEKGVHGAIFKDWATGVEAQYQHIWAYATKEALPVDYILSPRFNLVRRETAPYIEHLGAGENPAGVGWAYPGIDYGQSIVRDYLLKLIDVEAKEPPPPDDGDNIIAELKDKLKEEEKNTAQAISRANIAESKLKKIHSISREDVIL